MINIPKIIYLQIEYFDYIENFEEITGDVSWCSDKIYEHDIKYIKYSDYLAKVKKLNQKIKELEFDINVFTATNFRK